MRAFLVVLVALTCFSPEAWAQQKVGAEFRVNTYAKLDQMHSSPAGLSNGDFVVTWQSRLQNGSAWAVYGQRYRAVGTRVGGEFQVNTFTAIKQGGQNNPSAAGLVDGGFVVVWVSWLQDGDRFGVYGQRYNSRGARVGSEFQVNTFTPDEQEAPSIAALGDGGFVVAWTSASQDGKSAGVYAQRFSPAGARAGGEFRVSPDISGAPSVAAFGGGGFVVTWEVDAVQGQRFSASGARLGSVFQINTYTGSAQAPRVAGLSGGGFVVTWESDGQDGSGWGIYAQRYTTVGARVGKEFRVNIYTVDQQLQPSVVGLSDGGFVITWDSSDRAGTGIFVQRFSATGARVGKNFRVNTYRRDTQRNPAVAALSNGGFVVTWDSDGQDGSGFGVYGQRFSP